MERLQDSSSPSDYSFCCLPMWISDTLNRSRGGSYSSGVSMRGPGDVLHHTSSQTERPQRKQASCRTITSCAAALTSTALGLCAGAPRLHIINCKTRDMSELLHPAVVTAITLSGGL